ncbi:Ig-like domain-containing protein [Alysiella crassa]|uniref:Bacterial Ig domain-containing protein n=1 Tax=Alysiella crassa TaxID=153491 RepID=A0A376BVJ2_9NEIS|nr:Ig-like domain-containing protein [Alysiella crassa]UOP06325.1 Ig-like domain-containing protein [Alysiella crassa]SSY80833.1 Uncharacterised protein [Alysiella crassa]
MSVTVKVLNASKTIASHTAEAGKPLVLEAKNKVNYQLIDNATGFAPENIMTLRQGDDLMIMLNDGDTNSDIVIKGYFDGKTDSLLVGLHETGKMYAYIPVSAKPTDAITVLAEQVSSMQALGGTELSAEPTWTSYAPQGWLRILAPFMFAAVAAAVVASDDEDDSSSTTDTSADTNNTNPTPTTPTTPTPPDDTTPPVVPTATLSANGIVVSGKTEANAKVSVTAGSLKATGMADASGNYSVNLPEVLKNGEKISVTATDAAGNSSAATTLTAPTTPAPVVDTTPPTVPTATLSANGIVVSGKTEANAKVSVTAGSLKATGMADASGNYSVNLPEVLKNGEKISVTATDAAGNSSVATTLTAPTTPAPVVDTTAPVVPTATLSANGIVVSGKTEANAKVSVTAGSLKATGMADASGNYSVNLPEVLKNGEQISVIATDAAGNSSAATTLTAPTTPTTPAPVVDTTPPTVPTATLSANGIVVSGKTEANAKVTVVAGSLQATGMADASGNYSVNLPEVLKNGEQISVSATDSAGNSSSSTTLTAADQTPPQINAALDVSGSLITGTTEAGATVSANGVSTTADSTGAYSLTLPTAQTNGESITITSVDTSGNSSSHVLMANDSTAPETLTAELSSDGLTVSGSTEPNAVVTVNGVSGTANANGAYAITLPTALLNKEEITVSASDKAGNSITQTLTAADKTPPAEVGATLSDDGMSIVGKTEAGATVSANGVSTTADENGAYTLTLPEKQLNGETITVTATDTANNTTTQTIVAKDTTAPNTLEASVSNTADSTVISGTTEANATVYIDTDGDPKTIEATATANAAGAFSVALPNVLNQGEKLTLWASDEAGNTSAAFVATAPTQDTTAPAAPEAKISEDGLSISGTTEANATVNIQVGNETYTTTADENGAFSHTFAEALSNGETVEITATDAAQNTSEKTTLTAADTVPPSAPLISAATDGSFTVALSNDAVTATIDYVGEDDKTHQLVLNKTDGVWALADPSVAGVTITDNLVTLAPETVKDHISITVSNADAAGLSASAISEPAADHNPPAEPVFKIENDILTITPDVEAATLTVAYVDAAGEIHEATFLQSDQGWLDNNPQDQATIDVETGVVSLPMVNLLGGETVFVTVSDGALSNSGSLKVEDTIPPSDLADLIVGNGDTFLTANEITNNQVNVLVKLPSSGVNVGDVLMVNGTETVLSNSHINLGEVSLTLDAPTEGEKFTVTAQLKDSAGLTSGSLNKEFTRDTTVPGDSNGDGVADVQGRPSVIIQDSKGTSGYINAEDVNADGKVSVNITFPANSGYAAGDMLHISTAAGALEPIALTDEMIANGYVLAVEPTEGVNTITAYVQDVAGNSTLVGSDKSMLDDSVLLPPVVEIMDGGDGVLGATELMNNQGTAQITVPAGYTVGAVLEITYPNQSTEQITLTEVHLQEPITVKFDVVNGDNTVSATLTNVSGSLSRVGSDTVSVDTTAPSAPQVMIVGGEDGYIQESDIVDGKVNVKVTLPENGGYAVGDVLTITDSMGNTQTMPLTEEIIKNGVTVQVNPVTGNHVITATVSDLVGNVSAAAKAEAARDNGFPGDSNQDNIADEIGSPVVSVMDDVADLDVINSGDVQQGLVDVHIAVSAQNGYSVGDVLHLTAPNGSLQEIVLTDEHLKNGVVVAKVKPVLGENTVTAYVKDSDGNQSLVGTGSSVLDENTELAPMVMLETGTDGLINAAQYVANNNQITSKIELPATAQAGDVLFVELKAADTLLSTEQITLTAEHISAGSLKHSFTTDTEGEQTVNVYYKTGENVQSDSSAVRFNYDKTPPVITLTANDDGSVSYSMDAADANAQLTFTVDGNTVELKADVKTEGNIITGTISGDQILDGATVVVVASDFAGNVSDEVSVVAKAGGDKDVTAPVLTEVMVIDNGATVSGSTEAGAIVSVNGVTTTANEQGKFSVSLTKPLINKENIDVFVQDVAGNSSTTTTLTAPDLTPPTMPTASLSDDGLTVTGTTEAGVKVTVNGVETTANDKGEFSVTLPNALLNKEEIAVVATDLAGNQSTFTFQAADKTAPVVSDLRLSANGIVVSGSTEAGATVNVDYTGDGQVDVTGVADSTGAFSVNLPTALINGETIAVFAHDEANNNSPMMTITASDGIAPVEPTAALSEDGLTVSGTAEAGSTVSANGVSATADSQGAYSFRLPEAQLNGENLTVVSTDAAGNSSTTTVVAKDSTAPQVLTAEMANNGGSISGNTEANATVWVDVDGDAKYDVSAMANAVGTYTVQLATPLDNGETVSVVAVDSANNSSTALSLTAPMKDRIAPEIISAEISADGSVVSGKTEAGATVTVNGVSTTANEQGEFSLTLIMPLTNGENVLVIATDQDNNSSEPTTLIAPDLQAPNAPLMTADNNGAITIVLDTEAVKASVVYTDEQDVPHTATLSKDDNGVWTLDDGSLKGISVTDNMVVIAPEAVKDYSIVSATNADMKGNESFAATAEAADHNPPAKPVFAVSEDGLTLNITPAVDASVLNVIYQTATGDIVEAQIIQTPMGWLKGSNVADNVSVDAPTGTVSLPLGILAGGTSVVANNQDAKGLGAESEHLVVDNIAPAAPADIIVGDDNAYLTANEIVDGKVKVIIKLPNEGVNLGDILVVNEVEHVIDSTDINTGEYTLTLNAPEEGKELAVNAYLKDAKPNLSDSLKATYTRDTSVPGDSNQDGQADDAGKPVVIIQDAQGTSGYINAEDVNTDGDVLVNITFPSNSGYVQGDILHVVMTDGTEQTVALTNDMIANGYSLTVKPVEGVNTVTAYVTDLAGNQSLSGSDKSTLDDSVALPPELTIVDVNRDGYLSGNELNQFTNKADVDITIPAGYTVGATLNVVYPNGSTEEIKLTEEHLLQGVRVSMDVVDGSNTIRATLTQISGSVSKEGSSTIEVDTLSPAVPNIEIIGLDKGYFDESDLVDGKLQVKVSFPDKDRYHAGDVLTVRDASGSLQTVKLTTDDISNGVTLGVTPTEGNNAITASVSDVAGNASGLSQADGIRDNGKPSDPLISINDDGDNEINASDLNSDKQVSVSVMLPLGGGYSVGDTLHLTINGETQTFALTADHVNRGVLSTAFTPVPETNKVEAYITDEQGNRTEVVSATSENHSNVPSNNDLSLTVLDNSNIAEVQAKMSDESQNIDLAQADSNAVLGGASANEAITLDMQDGVDVFSSPQNIPMQHMTLNMGAGNDRVAVQQISDSARVNLGAGDDLLELGNNQGMVDGGEGRDMVAFGSPDTNVTVENHFSNFETFALFAGGSLKLTEKALLDNHAAELSDSNGVSYSNVLVIDGADNASVGLWEGLGRARPVEYNGQSYQVYKAQLNGSDYQIWIDSDISVK